VSTFLTIRWRALRVQQGASTGRARCSGWGGEQTRSAAPTETRARLTRRQTHCWGGGGHLAAYDPRQDRIGDQNGHQSQNHKGQSGNQTGLQPVHRSDHAVLSLTQFWISDAKLDHRNRRFQLICPSFYCFFSLLRRCYKNKTAVGEKTYQQKAQRKAHLLLSRVLVCSKKNGDGRGGAEGGRPFGAKCS